MNKKNKMNRLLKVCVKIMNKVSVKICNAREIGKKMTKFILIEKVIFADN